MTATVADAPVRAETVTLGRVVRFEVVKLVAQWRIRLVLVACLVAPALYSAVVSRQTSLPADAVYGRLMDQSGWAGSLTILVSLGTLLLPLLTSVVAGDIFAVEDRLGTWRHVLVAVRSPRRVFIAKTIAALTVTLTLLGCLLVSSAAGGLLSIGSHPLPGLDGHQLGSGELARTVVLSWLTLVAPTLAFSAVGLLGSVALGRSPLGLLAPVGLALVLMGVQVMPVPVALRVALPMNAFISYRGLLTEPMQLDALWIGLLVCLSWTALATLLAYRLFVRRDFTDLANDGSARRFLVTGLVPLVGLAGLTTVLVATTTGATGSGIDRPKLEDAVSRSFANLYVLQTERLHRPAVTVDELQASAECDKGGDLVEDEGAGSGWRCTVRWTLPGSTAVGTAVYQLDVRPEGRFVADGDGPKEVNGFFQVRGPAGDAPNPLWQFDGVVDLLDTPTKGQQ
ncbi:ABC transporter permease [Nocardioides sp.]|uniref:ABC transporter permease n=1 Tax=Nocardioides sp. TaxID=35761 RepID=UPI0025E727C5|nr:ABC transporter permease [Nocardioides sp.]